MIYARQFPECCASGSFDYYSSHFVWHIFTILAAYAHYATVVSVYTYRLHSTCPA